MGGEGRREQEEVAEELAPKLSSTADSQHHTASQRIDGSAERRAEATHKQCIDPGRCDFVFQPACREYEVGVRREDSIAGSTRKHSR